MNLKQLDKFRRYHHTGAGYGVFGLVELGLSYLFASLAVNSGSLWQWTLALILLVGFGQNFVRLIGALAHGKRKAS